MSRRIITDHSAALYARRLRDEAGLTVAALARETGHNPDTLARAIARRRGPPLAALTASATLTLSGAPQAPAQVNPVTALKRFPRPAVPRAAQAPLLAAALARNTTPAALAAEILCIVLTAGLLQAVLDDDPVPAATPAALVPEPAGAA